MHKTSSPYAPPVHIDTKPEVRPAMNDNWEARRELAEALRQLNSAVLSAAAPSELIRAVAANVKADAARIEANQRLFGHQALSAHITAELGEAPDLYYEISPAIGQSNAVAPPMHIWQEDGRTYAEASTGWAYEGPPGSLHGGVISLLFDQLLGIAQRITGTPGVTGNLTIRYHHPTPLNKKLHFVAYVDRVEGRKKFMISELWVDDKRTASCEAVFIEINRLPGVGVVGSAAPATG